MDKVKTLDDLHDYVILTLLENDCETLTDLIIVKWSNGMTSCAGKAYYKSTSIPHCEVRLSPHILEQMTDEQRINTAVHEAAHIVVLHRYFTGGIAWKPSPHGYEWESVMHKMGQHASVRHTVKVTKRRIARNFAADCHGCGEEFSITQRKWMNMVKAGRPYRCRTCGGSVHPRTPKNMSEVAAHRGEDNK